MSKDQPIIFIVDEDKKYILRLKDHLDEKLPINTRIYTYTSGEECVANLSLQPDIVVLNYYFSPIDAEIPGKKKLNGLELIELLKADNHDVHLILLTNETDVEVANIAIKEGEYDYIVKYEYAPVQLQYLISNILLHRMYTQKVNYWKWGAIAIGVLLILMIIYLVTGARH